MGDENDLEAVVASLGSRRFPEGTMEYYEKYQGSWYSGRDSSPAASEDKPVVVPKCDPIDKK